MNVIGRIGFAFLISGALIINGYIIMVVLRFLFGGTIPAWAQATLTVIILGLMFMFLSAAYDRYKNARKEHATQ